MSAPSDLVDDTRLETRFLGDTICHIYNEPDSTRGKRQVLRREFWQREGKLGAGSFGTVWLERCRHGAPEHRELRAVKEYERPRHKFDCHRELEAIAKFSHPKFSRCFVSSWGWFEKGDVFYLTMEYLPLGDLSSYFARVDTPLPAVEVQEIVFQVLEGLSFMHDKSFAHRDVKPANILLQRQPPDSWWVKISDFGLSKRFHDSKAISSTIKGTLAFMAPELHGVSDEDSNSNPFASDMWALGEMTHLLLTRQHVFQNTFALFEYTQPDQTFPLQILQQIQAEENTCLFIQSLMKPRPHERATASDALRHPWLSDIFDSSHLSETASVLSVDAFPLSDALAPELIDTPSGSEVSGPPSRHINTSTSTTLLQGSRNDVFSAHQEPQPLTSYTNSEEWLDIDTESEVHDSRQEGDDPIRPSPSVETSSAYSDSVSSSYQSEPLSIHPFRGDSRFSPTFMLENDWSHVDTEDGTYDSHRKGNRFSDSLVPDPLVIPCSTPLLNRSISSPMIDANRSSEYQNLKINSTDTQASLSGVRRRNNSNSPQRSNLSFSSFDREQRATNTSPYLDDDDTIEKPGYPSSVPEVSPTPMGAMALHPRDSNSSLEVHLDKAETHYENKLPKGIILYSKETTVSPKPMGVRILSPRSSNSSLEVNVNASMTYNEHNSRIVTMCYSQKARWISSFPLAVSTDACYWKIHTDKHTGFRIRGTQVSHRGKLVQFEYLNGSKSQRYTITDEKLFSSPFPKAHFAATSCKDVSAAGVPIVIYQTRLGQICIAKRQTVIHCMQEAGEVQNIQVSPDGRFFLTRSSFRTVLWSIEKLLRKRTGKPLNTKILEPSATYRLRTTAFSPRRNLLACVSISSRSGSHDTNNKDMELTVIRLDSLESMVYARFDSKFHSPLNVMFLSDPKLIFSRDSSILAVVLYQEMMVWNSESNELVRHDLSWLNGSKRASSLNTWGNHLFELDEHLLFVLPYSRHQVNNKGKLRVYDMKLKKTYCLHLSEYSGHATHWEKIFWSGEGSLLGTMHDRGSKESLRVYELLTERDVRELMTGEYARDDSG